MSGWICLHRSIRDNWIFKDAERLKAWLCILIEVNHTKNIVALGNTLVECGRGESLKSLDTWTRVFGKNWNKSRVRRFFKLLEADSMIVIKSIPKTTHLSVCNYDEYQVTPTRKRHASGTQATPNNNENNENNNIPCKNIVNFLNKQTGKKYKSSSKKTYALIKSRFSDGFSENDFRIVIENKVAAWLDDPKMSKFLRPETLFGNKFEGYLNEEIKQQGEWE